MKKNSLSYTLLLTITSIIIVSGIHIFQNGTDEEAIRTLIQWTAKLSAFLFAITFGISGFQHTFKDRISKHLIPYRPNLGLAFGAVHTAHLIFLIWLQNSIHPVFTLAKKSSLMAGGLAYILMYLMMLTTFSHFKAKLSTQQWKILHLLGGYWIWIIFFRSYTKQVLYQDRGYFLFALLLLVLILRLIQLFSKRNNILTFRAN